MKKINDMLMFYLLVIGVPTLSGLGVYNLLGIQTVQIIIMCLVVCAMTVFMFNLWIMADKFLRKEKKK